MIKIVHGTVHGKTIELDENLGVPEGQQVEIQVTRISKPAQWGEGLRRCAGALVHEWTEADDRILAEIHDSR